MPPHCRGIALNFPGAYFPRCSRAWKIQGRRRPHRHDQGTALSCSNCKSPIGIPTRPSWGEEITDPGDHHEAIWAFTMAGMRIP